MAVLHSLGLPLPSITRAFIIEQLALGLLTTLPGLPAGSWLIRTTLGLPLPPQVVSMAIVSLTAINFL